MQKEKSRIDGFINEKQDLCEDYKMLADLKTISEDYFGNNKNINGKVTEAFAILSSHRLPLAFVEDIEEYITGIKNWLVKYMGYASGDFPYVLVHIDSNYSYIPRAYLYPDGMSSRVGFCSVEMFKEKIVHELMHALSFIKDRFASEILAHYAEYSGLGLFETIYAEQEKSGLSVKDVLMYNKDDLPDIYNMFFGNGMGRAAVIGPHNYLAFYCIYLYQFLKSQSSQKAVIEFISKSDDCSCLEENEQLFRKIFNFDIKVTDALVRQSLQNPQKGFMEEDALEKICSRNIDYHIIKLIYRKTAVKKFSKVENIDYKLRIVKTDFQLYMNGVGLGYHDSFLLRKITKTVNDILDEDDKKYDAWVLRYYVLTEYIIVHYVKRDKVEGSKPAYGRRLIDSVKTALTMLDLLDRDNIETKMVYARYYLYYPKRYGGDPKKGISYLHEVYEMDGERKDAYYEFIRYFYSIGKKERANEWVKKYEDRFGIEMDTKLLNF